MQNQIAEMISKIDFKEEELSGILKTIFNSTLEGVLIKDINSTYVLMNEVFKKHSNAIKSSTEISRDSDYLTKENTEFLKKADEYILKNLKEIDFEIQVEEKFLSVHGKPLIYNDRCFGIIYFTKDITDKKELEDNFKKDHRKLKSLLENVPLIIYMKDINRNYVIGSKVAYDFYKNGIDYISSIKIDMQRAEEETTKEDNYVLENNLQLVKEKFAYDFEGNVHFYKINKAPITNENNKVVGMITIVKNIDTQKRLELQRASFIATLTHDLKNPVLGQIRALELLNNPAFGELNDEQKEIIDCTLTSCKFMKAMLDGMLSTYSADNGIIKLNYSKNDFLVLTKECLDNVSYLSKDKNIKIVFKNKIKNPVFYFDNIQIKRVVMNLLVNSIRYAYKDTSIEVIIEEKDDKIGFKFKNKSNYISKEKIKNIFGRYVTYSDISKEHGVGLGLYISKKIVNLHNGEIFAKSRKDNTASFGFIIPKKNEL